MAFSGNALSVTFKKELMFGAHDFDTSTGDTYKCALFTNSAVPTDFGGSGSTMDATVANYATNNEVTGTNYSAGGQTMNTIDPTFTGTTAFVDFDNVVFSTVTINSVRGAIVYNTTPNTTSIALTNPAICVLDFGNDKAASAGDFTIIMPTADASNALIRIA